MKKFKNSPLKIALASVFLLVLGCNDILVETNRTSLSPDFFKTEEGVEALLAGGYHSFRYFYATENGMHLNVWGTDEFTHGQQQTNPPLNIYESILPSNGQIGDIWNRCYAAINNLNGVIHFAPSIQSYDGADAAVGEAKYLRAHCYLMLLNQFGDAVLSFGDAGPLEFNMYASAKASFAGFEAVIDAIIGDLEDAVTKLPNTQSQAGHAWKASALHLLAEAYLFKAWSSVGTNQDFQDAYDNAMELINNKATYGVDLEANYADIWVNGNEHGKEVLFTAEYNDNQTFNDINAFGGPADQNKSGFFFNCFYEQNTPGVTRTPEYGRVWVRYKPTPWLTDTAFADKVNDTRFNASFRSVWYCNSESKSNPVWTQAEVDEGIPGAVVGEQKLSLGDTAIFVVPKHLETKFEPLKDRKPYVMFLPDTATNQHLYFFRPGSGLTLTGDPYDNYDGTNELKPSDPGNSNSRLLHTNNKYYPSLTKYIDTDKTQGNVNTTSTRPFIIHRLAETYLLAAEAAVGMSQFSDAADLINVVRSRAGAITTNTLADVTAEGIDYILDERTRELAGENTRWSDLVRVGKLIERVTLHNQQAAFSIQPYHNKRPVPQGQIDSAFDPSTSDNVFPQNTGYDGN